MIWCDGLMMDEAYLCCNVEKETETIKVKNKAEVIFSGKKIKMETGVTKKY